MKIFFPKELDSEKRISITPDFLKKYIDSGLKVSVQTSIGLHFGFKDEIYKELGAEIVDRKKGLKEGNIICSVNKLSKDDLTNVEENSLVVSFLDPFNDQDLVDKRDKGKKYSNYLNSTESSNSDDSTFVDYLFYTNVYSNTPNLKGSITITNYNSIIDKVSSTLTLKMTSPLSPQGYPD